MLVKDIIVRKYTSVSEKDTISSLLGKSRRTKHFYAVIVDNKGQYKGMAEKKSLLGLNIDSSKTKVAKVLDRAPTLSPDDTIEKAIKLFYTSEHHALAVVEGKTVKGVIRAGDALKVLRGSFSRIKAKDVSNKNILTLQEDDPISKAAKWFKTKGIGRAPVVDKKGTMVGICTIEDILHKYHIFPPGRIDTLRGKGKGSTSAEERSSRGNLPISNLRSPQLYTIKPNDPLTKAIDLFAQYGISSVIVASSDKPIGIITIKDLLRIVK